MKNFIKKCLFSSGPAALLLLFVFNNLYAQDSTTYRIRMPTANYSAILIRVSTTDTSNGAYVNKYNAHEFRVAQTGFYKLWGDPTGGTSYVEDTDWGGSDGKYLTCPDLMDQDLYKNKLYATDYDSLGAAFDALSALDTAALYIPAGTYTIYDSLNLVFKRAGQAFWGIYGDPGATIIRAAPTYFDSLKNMLNVVTLGAYSSTDTVISNLNISGIIWNFANEGGTYRDWALAGTDSAWHALRSYRNDDWDRYNPDAAGDTSFAQQVLWSDSQGLIIQTIGRILNLNITECSFDSSFYGAIRIRPYFQNGTFTACVEGGQITNCQFRAIRGGPAIANLWNGVRTISDNTFRNVACALFNGTGGNTFSHNRIEEYDSCGIYCDYTNWTSITDNVISEGAGPAMIFSGNCVGIVSNNSTLNIWADDSHLGTARLGDSTLAIIKFENSFGVNTAYPRGLVITNNVHSTSDPNYDGYTKYYVGATPDALADSCKNNIIQNNIIRYGLGKDIRLGVTNISRLKNMTFPNAVSKNSWDQSDSLWIAGIDTIHTSGGGDVRWLRILLPDGSWFYVAKDTSAIND